MEAKIAIVSIGVLIGIIVVWIFLTWLLDKYE
jgi:hypothetical protein